MNTQKYSWNRQTNMLQPKAGMEKPDWNQYARPVMARLYEERMQEYSAHIASLPAPVAVSPEFAEAYKDKPEGWEYEEGKDFKMDWRKPVIESEEDYNTALYESKHELTQQPHKVAYPILLFRELRNSINKNHKSMNNAFHLQSGYFFTRQINGDVTIARYDGDRLLSEFTVQDSEWASLVASMSKQGETSETFKQALAFHNENSKQATGSE